MDELVFAPVVIATLNRTEHFKRCIESLGKCKYADRTELFISVDYPPAAKYEEGYRQICAYLKKGFSQFKEVHISYQKENLGAKNNLRFLHELVLQKFDRYILTEDDNEFSYNFLEYMDKGLTLFEKNEKVINICALQDQGPWNAEKDTAVFQQNCPAYGMGVWRQKEDQLERIITEYLLNDIGKKPEKINVLRKKSRTCFQQYIEGILCGKNPIFWKDDHTIRLCDTTRTIYAICADKYFVAPRVTKARNWGFDGSGANMKKKQLDPCKAWKLDTDEGFEFEISFDQEKFEQYNKYIHEHLLKIPNIYVWKAGIKYLLYLLRKGEN